MLVEYTADRFDVNHGDGGRDRLRNVDSQRH
jgi:hypothetical protein